MKLTTHPLAEPLVAWPQAAVPVDADLILRLRVSLARLLAHGDALAATFYRMLFENYPGVRALFPTDLSQQQSKLTKSLVWVVANLDRREQLVPAVRELGRRHVGYGAAVEHYPLVRETLIAAMARTAAGEWSDALAADWRLSIDLIAHHMIAGMSAATSTSAAAAATSTVPR